MIIRIPNYMIRWKLEGTDGRLNDMSIRKFFSVTVYKYSVANTSKHMLKCYERPKMVYNCALRKWEMFGSPIEYEMGTIQL